MPFSINSSPDQSLDEKIRSLSAEDYVRILTSVETLIEKGYIDPELKNSVLTKFIDDKLEKDKKSA